MAKFGEIEDRGEDDKRKRSLELNNPLEKPLMLFFPKSIDISALLICTRPWKISEVYLKTQRRRLTRNELVIIGSD